MAAKKRTTRASRQADLARRAARVSLPPRADVCVVGGGASGLVAGICAAERGATAVVLERDYECGRKLLATGNGRCNFLNTRLDAEAFHQAAFVGAVAGGSWANDALAFFAASGLAWAEEGEGRLYPLSRQASSVRNVLLARARRAGVILCAGREVTDASRRGGAWTIGVSERFCANEQRSIEAETLVVATGGGIDAFARALGLKTVPCAPVLCPLACSGADFAALDGRRAHAALTLRRNGAAVASERGEVLFRDYGVSGIAAFNLSRHARVRDELDLDLLPDVALEDLLARAAAAGSLDGVLDPAIATVLLGGLGHEVGAWPLDGQVLACALRTAKAWRLTVTGLADAARAQVQRGGLATSQFDPSTLEARAVRGVFACGEALDVDGPCGGFNLAWAWKSGIVAGSSAADAALRGANR